MVQYTHMRNNASLIYNFVLIIGDFLALVAAFIVAFLLRVRFEVGLDHGPVPPVSGRAFLGAFLVILPFWILIFALLGLYNSGIYEKRFKELGRLLIGSFIGLLLVIFWNFLSSEPIFPARLVPIYGFVLAFLFLVIFRNLARAARGRLFGNGVGLTKVLLVGNTSMTREILEWLSEPKSGYKVVGVVGGQEGQSERYPAKLYRGFDEFLRSHKGELHGIIQTELYADEARNSRILKYSQENHVGYRFVPGNTELFTGKLEVELFRSGVPVINVHQTALFGWGRIVKRLFDLVATSAALILALPFMLIIAALIKMREPGAPVLYTPKRLSRFGGKYKHYKFRTMYWEYCMSPEEGFAKMGRPDLLKRFRENGDQLPKDPRITPVGRFLRKTSLDELPQLFNVLRGDLSIVGPRALDPVDVERYSKKNLILAVKTGLTGLAVVSGRREISFEERRKLDLYYVQNWSFWLDIVIIIKTIKVVLSGRGTNA